jgi:hypothetical protein
MEGSRLFVIIKQYSKDLPNPRAARARQEKKLSAAKNVDKNKNILKCQLISKITTGHVPMSIYKVSLVFAKHVGRTSFTRTQVDHKIAKFAIKRVMLPYLSRKSLKLLIHHSVYLSPIYHYRPMSFQTVLSVIWKVPQPSIACCKYWIFRLMAL